MLLATLIFSTSVILPSSHAVAYVGRWDMTDRAAPACRWPACEVRIRVENASWLSADLDESGGNVWQVVVDGVPDQVLTLKPGRHAYTLSLPALPLRSARPVVRTVELVKRTEAFVGTTRFRGFELIGPAPLTPMTVRRHLEVVGDSITCGYGNEGANQNEHFKPATENAYMSYASIAARLVDADVSIIAWSGRKMWPDNTMPDIYDMILPPQAIPAYDFRGPAPQAVVINLATNDFGPGNPDEGKWTAAYEAFIRRIWGHYPKALVYCATGSMMSDAYPPGRKPLSTLVGYLQRMIARMNDKRLRLIQFEPQKMENGLGADWHPSVKTDEIMGGQLAEQLKRDLGWKTG
ncbi:MAG: SGNH/GDSL hydrolase family protein [Fimbriimonadaceae bacterium]